MSLTCLTCVCGERCPRRGRRAKGQPAGRAGQGGKHCGRRVTFVVCPCAVWWWWCRVVVVQGSFGRAGAGLAALSALALCTLGLLGFFNSKCVPFRSLMRVFPSALAKQDLVLLTASSLAGRDLRSSCPRCATTAASASWPRRFEETSLLCIPRPRPRAKKARSMRWAAVCALRAA
jgi:hypothetical protein